jgi:hypothetical protein
MKQILAQKIAFNYIFISIKRQKVTFPHFKKVKNKNTEKTWSKTLTLFNFGKI